MGGRFVYPIAVLQKAGSELLAPAGQSLRAVKSLSEKGSRDCLPHTM